MVTFEAVTGEKGIGTYSCTKETTGSHLIENVTLEDGRKADFVWARKMELPVTPKCRHCGKETNDVISGRPAHAECDSAYHGDDDVIGIPSK